jgi:hypothetical protein
LDDVSREPLKEMRVLKHVGTVLIVLLPMKRE